MKTFSIENHSCISRFMYVRHATGLLEDGISLLHWATLIFISFFCVHIMLIHPMRCCSVQFVFGLLIIKHTLMQIGHKWEILPGFSQRNILCQNQPLPHDPRQWRPKRALSQALPSDGRDRVNVSWSKLLLLLFCPELQVWYVDYFSMHLSNWIT